MVPIRILCALVLLLATASARPLPKAVVVNMKRNEKRFEGVKRELDREGVKFERLEAVEGKKLNASERRSQVTALARVFLTPGMMGCFLSHRRCWERCAATGEDLLVFEDDVVVEPDFARRLCVAMDDLPANWDVMLLGALGLVHPERKYGLWWLLHFLPSVFFLPWHGFRWKPRISELVHVPLRPAGTHAYVISPAGARRLLDACPRASYHVDVIAWGTKQLQLFCCNPLLAMQTHADTTIGGREDWAWVKRWLSKAGISLVFDQYTGADIAWAYNTPLLRLGGDSWFVLMSTGRATSLFMLGVLASVPTRSLPLFYANAALLLAQIVVVRLLTTFLGPRAPSAEPATAAPQLVDI